MPASCTCKGNINTTGIGRSPDHGGRTSFVVRDDVAPSILVNVRTTVNVAEGLISDTVLLVQVTVLPSVVVITSRGLRIGRLDCVSTDVLSMSTMTSAFTNSFSTGELELQNIDTAKIAVRTERVYNMGKC